MYYKEFYYTNTLKSDNKMHWKYYFKWQMYIYIYIYGEEERKRERGVIHFITGYYFEFFLK